MSTKGGNKRANVYKGRG